MPAFRKKPVEIEAFQVTAGNLDALASWCGGFTLARKPRVVIDTLEGEMTAHIGDWIIKGVEGEFYPCKARIFAATYEAA